MKKRAPVMAGTALALVMAATQASAVPQAGRSLSPQDVAPASSHAGGMAPVLLAQADEDLTEEERLLRRQQQEAEEEATKEAPAEPPVDEAPAAEEAPAEEAPAPAEEAPTPAEQTPVDEAPAGEQPAEEAPVEAPPVDTAPVEDAPVDEAPAEPPASEQAPVDEAAEPEPEAETPPEAPAPEPAPVDEAPAGQPPVEQPPAAETPEDAPTPDEAPADETPADAPTPEQAPADGASEAETPAEAPVPAEAPADTQPAGDADANADVDAGQASGDEPQAGNEAPLLDSQKEDAASGEPAASGEQQQQADTPPPPASDEEARADAQPAEVESVRAEEGERTDRRERRRERREDADVIREIGDRIVIQLNNQIVVQSDDRGRIGRDAEEVYYEDLPRGRTRETIIRPNGVQVVTVYDRYGDVVRRSRITQDGREYVLVYAARDDRDGPRGWRDPAADLPPLRLRIPRNEYILEARNVDDPDVYYDFLDQPPVERVERLYTIDEVKYSARVRDIARRVELDTITFDFGSAAISESAIPQLEGVAGAIERLLRDNPAETFLIEGHTDAVGSDEANLALSDQRAESVAAALSNVFGIPPENLVTQGYGERYLKIETQEPEQENRRVVMRRITPLVAPIASR